MARYGEVYQWRSRPEGTWGIGRGFRRPGAGFGGARSSGFIGRPAGGSPRGSFGGPARFDSNRDFADDVSMSGRPRGGFTRGYADDFATRGRAYADDFTARNRGYADDYSVRNRGYSAEYRTRGRGYSDDFETAHGDPFGDRARRTPFRMIEGDWDDNFDRDSAVVSGRNRLDRERLDGDRLERERLGRDRQDRGRLDRGRFAHRPTDEREFGLGYSSAGGYGSEFSRGPYRGEMSRDTWGSSYDRDFGASRRRWLRGRGFSGWGY